MGYRYHWLGNGMDEAFDLMADMFWEYAGISQRWNC